MIVRKMDLKIVASSLALLCVISKVACQKTCPHLVEYMWSFGEYCPVCPVTRFLAGKMTSKRRIFVYIFRLISIRALVSYWEIEWSAVNNDRVLKDKFCQKIWVQYIKCNLRNACLKTRIFTANVLLINYFAT